MAAPKVFHGARAKVSIYDPTTGTYRLVGIWNQFGYSINYDVQPSFILGRYSAAALTTTGIEPVSITAQGWRVVDHDAFVEGRFTNLKDMLNQEYLILSVIDRQTGKEIARIRDCIPTGTSQSVSARALVEMTNSYMGLLMDSESGEQMEAASASTLPET